jgi:hypothetical protein
LILQSHNSSAAGITPAALTQNTMNNIKELLKIRRALPSGAITRIAAGSGQPYRLTYRTIRGEIKFWDHRHDAVIECAKHELKLRGITLSGSGQQKRNVRKHQTPTESTTDV